MNLHMFLLLIVVIATSTKLSQAKTHFDSTSLLEANDRTLELAIDEDTSAIQGPLPVVVLRHKRSHLNEGDKWQKRCHRYCKTNSCRIYKRRRAHARCGVCKLHVCGIKPPL